MTACPTATRLNNSLRRLIVDLIDKEQWSSLSKDVKGNAYEFHNLSVPLNSIGIPLIAAVPRTRRMAPCQTTLVVLQTAFISRAGVCAELVEEIRLGHHLVLSEFILEAWNFSEVLMGAVLRRKKSLFSSKSIPSLLKSLLLAQSRDW